MFVSYSWRKKDLRYSLSKFGKWITKVRKIKWFTRKTHYIRSVVLRRTWLPFLHFYVSNLTGNREEKRKDCNLFGHWNVLLSWSIDLRLTVLATRSVFRGLFIDDKQLVARASYKANVRWKGTVNNDACITCFNFHWNGVLNQYVGYNLKCLTECDMELCDSQLLIFGRVYCYRRYSSAFRKWNAILW